MPNPISPYEPHEEKLIIGAALVTGASIVVQTQGGDFLTTFLGLSLAGVAANEVGKEIRNRVRAYSTRRRDWEYQRVQAQHLIDEHLGGKHNITGADVDMDLFRWTLRLYGHGHEAHRWDNGHKDSASLEILAKFLADLGLGQERAILAKLKKAKSGGSRAKFGSADTHS
jgi:hypothetical protein